MFWLFPVLLVSIFTIAYLWLKRRYDYWQLRNVKSRKPELFYGNYKDLLYGKSVQFKLLDELYREFPEEKVVGVYRGWTPAILLRDPNIIKNVMVKDFHMFQDRGVRNGDSFSDNLFSSEEETWRILRQKLTPMFTSGKIKNMMPLVQKAADAFTEYVESIVSHNKDHEIRELTAKYTLTVIGSCGFGLDVNVFADEDNVFSEIGKRVFTDSYIEKFVKTADMIIPDFEKVCRKIPFLRVGTPIHEFFQEFAAGVLADRQGKPKVRNDFIDLMVDLKEQGRLQRRDNDGKTTEIEMTMELFTAQVFVFYAAGFETSAGTTSFLLHELAIHQDVQDRVYKEICEVLERHDGKFTYEFLFDLKYLGMCLDEILRKYPIAGNLLRKCNENYKIPELDLEIEKGTNVFISTMGLHRDPKYFENPEVYDPERFTPENKKKIVQGSYLPFGEGPRHCIGMRFAKVQSLMGIAALLHKFRVERSEKTPLKLRLAGTHDIVASETGIWVKISRR